MTRRNCRLLVLFLALAAFTLAQTPEEGTSAGIENGKSWQKFTRSFKVVFLLAFHDGLLVAFSDSVGKGDVDSQAEAFGLYQRTYFPDRLTYGDIIRGIDKLYDDPANLLLPIPVAMKIFALRASGASEPSVETALARYRRLYTHPER